MRTHRTRVATNFINRFGLDGLQWLLDALGRGESGQTIAMHFSVSRERVRQWKNTFGQVVTLYQIYPEVEGLLNTVEREEPEPTFSTGVGVYLVEDVE